MAHDKVTSGAASDIQQCTRVARAMVTQLGFSDKLGTVAYADPQQEQFLGYSLGRQQTLLRSDAGDDRRGSAPTGAGSL